mmetsp:Transcript_71790/g.149983  ORF Transcript_71790/g.149983 Transcript_71790/m.149983 type:complete len:83 (+) Transcript_71790:462-710(+)
MHAMKHKKGQQHGCRLPSGGWVSDRKGKQRNKAEEDATCPVSHLCVRVRASTTSRQRLPTKGPTGKEAKLIIERQASTVYVR